MVQLKHQDKAASKLTNQTTQHPSTANIEAKILNENIDSSNSQSSGSFTDAENATNDINTNHSGESLENRSNENLTTKVDLSGKISVNGQHDTYYVAEVRLST